MQNRGKAAAKCWCWMALGWPRDLKVCQVLVLAGARMTEGLESDDKKDQPAEKRSAKRRAGIVGVDEGK